MIAPPPGVRVWLAAGVTDMRRGFDGLAAMVQQNLALDPFSGQLFVFRGRASVILPPCQKLTPRPHCPTMLPA